MLNLVRLASLASMIIVCLSANANSQTIYQNGFMPASDAYQDLPGVKDPKTLKPNIRYSCHTDMMPSFYPKGAYRDTFGSRGLNVQGYRCSNGGALTTYGTTNPVSKDWFPGINPSSSDF